MTNKIFSAMMYEMMGWNLDCRYKILGHKISFEGETIYVFDLMETEIYLDTKGKRQKKNAENQESAESSNNNIERTSLSNASEDNTSAEEINKNKEYVLKDGEKVGFVFPVYAWGPPGIVLRFIRQLKMKNPEYLFFVCTCGDDTGRTAQVFSSAIRRKGWHCVAGYSVTMPNTYVSLPGFDVDAEDVEEQKVQNAMARLDFINGELAGRIHMKHFNCHEGALPFTKTYLLRPLFNTFLMSPKPFYATDACIACKKCEKVCPVHNIEVTDKPQWGNNCTQCLGCYHICPLHAVQYGKATRAKGQYKRFLKK